MGIEDRRFTTRPRIVFAAPRIPYPLNTGLQQRMFYILKALAGIGDVDLVCYAEADQVPAGIDLEPLRRLCHTVEILDPPKTNWRYPAQSYRGSLERYVLSRRAFPIAEFPGLPLAERVAALGHGADLIWTARLYVAEWIKTGRERMIVDLDDLECIKRSRLLATQKRGPYRTLLHFDNLKLRLTEKSAPARYGRIAVCSHDDQRFFSQRFRGEALVVANGVSGGLLQYPPAEIEDSSIVFVGNMRYRPNVDAAFWFAREVFPMIRQSAPEARLYIVGHDDHHWVRPLHDDGSILVTGTVSDVAPYVTKAAVSVVPLRIGGGTRIKILESLALGTPVVSTTVGAEGLALVPGREIQIADTAASFASRVLKILRDPKLREELSTAGREVVSRRYTWEIIGERLQREVREFLQTCAAPHRRSESAVVVE